MAELILATDSLNKGRVKINKAIEQSEQALNTSNDAVGIANGAVNTANNAVAVATNLGNEAREIANLANSKSDSTQEQLDNIILDSGTSDAEVIQARGGHSLLYERLDSSDSQMADIKSAVSFNSEYANKQSKAQIIRNSGSDIPLIIAHTENPGNVTGTPAIQIYGYIEDKDTTQQALINILNTVTSECTHSETGVNVVHTILDSKQSHVGFMSTLVLKDACDQVQYGANFNITNCNDEGTTTDQEMVGCEVDLWSKYPAGNKNKVAFTAVAVGGGEIDEAYAVHSMNSKNGDGTTASGNFVTGIMIHPFSLNVSTGTGVNINSEHSTGIRVSKKSKFYGIALTPDAPSAGNIGLYMNNNYQTAIAIPANIPISLNDNGATGSIYYASAFQAISLGASRLMVESHETYDGGPLPTTCAGYLSMYVNGALRKVPYFAI